ncbi:ABC transporter ATP-binding protein [Clostridium gelidum]|uniref:ABC transporter ATP-binding protein n=1 Tax=Clostridium gelidum TaxID=704125 RepID=A0ABN6IPY3_9CLOT|nr:ABC transporter ATP-binding protein [Clostridium gelidum]BCZ44259.1 ABC transporter ATP-binding protein [Clostridium gelidum]
MGNEEFLKIDNVTKVYGKHNVLSNVTFSINEGEVIGLVGPNGAGKTTIMKIIVGLIRDYSGNVYLQGRNIRDKTKENRKNFGCVIEAPGFYPGLTGYENLKYFAKISGCEDEKEIDDIIKVLKIEDFMHKKVGKYSLGMKQRIGIAQAVLGKPDVLVLDEPTNGLDPNVVLEIRKFIKYVAQEKKIAVIISSHILSEIESMCEKVIFIKEGQIVDIVSLEQEKTVQNTIFVFKTKTPDRLIEFLKRNEITAQKDEACNVVANLEKYSIKGIFKMLEDSDISVEEVYKQKQSLEKRFMQTMEENEVE